MAERLTRQAPPGTTRPADPPTAPIEAPGVPIAAANRCERSQSFRMQAIETGISSRQSYSFTLSSSSSVSASLTGLTRDFDCRVGNSRCTNHWGSADDSWSGTLAASTDTVVVYPYGGGGSRVCHLDPNHLVADGRVEAGGLIGRWGGTGSHSGGAHLHLSYTDANGVQKPYYEDTDGEPTLNDSGC